MHGPRRPVPPAADACSGSTAGPPLPPQVAADLARRVRVLADPIRLRLVSILLVHEQGRASVYDLADALEPTEPAISHHLNVLLDAGLVDCEKTGIYSVTPLGADLFRHLVQLFGHPPHDEP